MNCPYCDKDISEELEQAYPHGGCQGFDFWCPYCGKIMEVAVELMPMFDTYKKQERQTGGDNDG